MVMKKDGTFIALIIFVTAVILTDAAFAVYLGVTVSAVTGGATFLPLSFRPFTISVAALNASLIPASLLYAFLRRK